MGIQRRGRVHAGRAPSALFSDDMTITLETQNATIVRGDTLDIRAPDGEVLEIIPAGTRQDGSVSVWYAPHPLLRHWLGWMARIDDTHWTFRMEALHIDLLNAIPELCESPAEEIAR